MNRIIMRPIILHTHIPPAFRVNQRANPLGPDRTGARSGKLTPPARYLFRPRSGVVARSQGVTEGSRVGMGWMGRRRGGGEERGGGAVELN